ncbi:MAG TPA: DUF6036 family nucleotidyltransferase [Hanamia sp.]|nr:DUF6036 family nucleotidyltransferase [Hanamia sp.]
MDIFDTDLINFWKSLNEFNVKYIMIGGFAVNLHGFSRATNDIDLWLKDEVNNKKNLGKALEQFGYGELSFEDLDFVPGWSDFYIGTGVRLDIMTTMLGLENISFDDALRYSSVAQVQENVNVPFLQINQLIKNKKATNRPKDIIDVAELEKILKIREQQEKL